MRQLTALIVGAATSTAADLQSVLHADGHVVEVLDSSGVRTSTLPGASTALDVVLVSAALSVADVTAVRTALEERCGRAPAMLVYADPSTAGLERHARRGMDYLVPPFLPVLVRSRLAACQKNEQLSETVQQAKDAAHLAMYERDLQIAREIQAGFLPSEVPQPPGWGIEVRFRPAREVGGDFYDAFPLVNGRRIGFVVADVCDKGVGAALFMALIRSLLRHTASHAGSLSLVGLDVQWGPSGEAGDFAHRTMATSAGVAPLLNAVAGTHGYMTQNHLAQGYFATLFFGVLDPVTGAVVYINCGHNPPVLHRADGEQAVLEPTGPALGMLAGSTFRLGRAHLGPGDTLFLYTDGVTEAKDPDGRFFTEDRMRSLVACGAGEGAELLLGRMDEALRAHVGAADQFDDITMMALHRRSGPVDASGVGSAPTDSA